MAHNSIDDLRESVDAGLLEYRTARKQLSAEKRKLADEQDHALAVSKTREIVQTIAREVQERSHAQIAFVVSRCLAAVWGDRYKFAIHFEKKRGKTEARLVFVRKDGLELDPLDESSGGVVDVAAFALRLAAIMMSQPARRRLVVLDEPFKNVRGEIYQERVREMVERICEELDFQVIINTDLAAIQTGTIIALE